MGPVEIGSLLAEAQGELLGLGAPRLCSCGAPLIERLGRGPRGPRRSRCDDCLREAERAREKAQYVPAPTLVSAECIVCGTSFAYDRKGKGRRRITCSDGCREKREAEKSLIYRGVPPLDPESLRAKYGETSCLTCGEVFSWKGSPLRYCDPACREAAYSGKPPSSRPLASHPVLRCNQCGKAFARKHSRQRFCSEACQTADWWERQKAGPTRGATRKKDTSPRPCRGCGKVFTPAYGTKRRVWCSEQCQKATQKKTWLAKKRSANATDIKCAHCGSVFVASKNTNRKFCSRSCSAAFSLIVADANKAANRKPRPCIQCGKTFTPAIGHKTLCSERCRKKRIRLQAKNSPNWRIGRALAKAARRTILKLVTVERVDPVEVFSRDRWICQLCHKRAPKKLLGTNDPRAPTLDHITPLGLGGDHSYRNCQCACRDCNNKKSAKLRGQLRLFG